MSRPGGMNVRRLDIVVCLLVVGLASAWANKGELVSLRAMTNLSIDTYVFAHEDNQVCWGDYINFYFARCIDRDVPIRGMDLFEVGWREKDGGLP